MALFGKKKEETSAKTPEEALLNIVQKVKSGDLDTIFMLAGTHESINKYLKKIDSLPSMLKSYAMGYVKKLFANTKLQIVNKEERADCYALKLQGFSVDGLELVDTAITDLSNHKTLSFDTFKKKPGLSEIPAIVAFGDSVVKKARTTSVEGVVRLKKDNDFDVICPDELIPLFLACTIDDGRAKVKEVMAKIK